MKSRRRVKPASTTRNIREANAVAKIKSLNPEKAHQPTIAKNVRSMTEEQLGLVTRTPLSTLKRLAAHQEDKGNRLFYH